MQVRVRALIWSGDRIVVRREPCMGRVQIALPAVRVKDHETLADAVTREVLEETGLCAEPRRLLCVAEVHAPHRA
jgi:ADP-ribose pyrophosphatase YjhB (NUDIX family)